MYYIFDLAFYKNIMLTYPKFLANIYAVKKNYFFLNQLHILKTICIKIYLKRKLVPMNKFHKFILCILAIFYSFFI